MAKAKKQDLPDTENRAMLGSMLNEVREIHIHLKALTQQSKDIQDAILPLRYDQHPELRYLVEIGEPNTIHTLADKMASLLDQVSDACYAALGRVSMRMEQAAAPKQE
jgi:hypothetical protein